MTTESMAAGDGMRVHCMPDGSCEFARRGVLLYWPPALLLAYTTIAVCYMRVALLVLARLERNIALLLFTLGYLALVLAPIDPALHWESHWGMRASFLPQQILSGAVLLLGAIGFAVARRRSR